MTSMYYRRFVFGLAMIYRIFSLMNSSTFSDMLFIKISFTIFCFFLLLEQLLQIPQVYSFSYYTGTTM